MTLDPRLARWLDALAATPGLTAARDSERLRRLHVDDALTALPLVDAGPVVDVGSGGGSPGLPIAAARPELDVVLLEASRRKCEFLAAMAAPFPNAGVVCERAEQHGRGAGRDAYAVALARALAPPAVAAEWCLPLVRPGGKAIVFAGEAGAGLDAVATLLGAAPPETVPVAGSEQRRLLVFAKIAATPERFPRRPGVARKRPLVRPRARE